MSEIALISARKSRLATDARNGSRGARTALQLAEDPDRFLSTIQIGITLIGILTGLFSGAALADDVGRWLHRLGLEPATTRMVGQIAIVAIVTYLSIVIGELVPKRIGLAAANAAAKTVARPMKVLSVIAMPAVWLLSISTSFLVRLIGLKDKDNSVTEEEIKSLIKNGTEAGEVRPVEQNIMERALVLGDLRVSAIMTPKNAVTSLYLDMTADEIRTTLAQELHNSYPVYRDRSGKTICGAVSLKQLVLAIDNPAFCLKNVLIQPQYFPESMSVYDALDRMKRYKVHFALICDEFGDLAGVITPGDILEGLVGAMSPQTASPEIIESDGSGTWRVDAQIQFYDFLSFFGLEDLFKPASYATLGGFILEELRRIPETGDEYIWNNMVFRITSMDGAKIGGITVKFLVDKD